MSPASPPALGRAGAAKRGPSEAWRPPASRARAGLPSVCSAGVRSCVRLAALRDGVMA